MVYALSVKSGKIFRTKVDNIHFDKYLGKAEITFEGAMKFCRRYWPDEYDEFKKVSSPNDYPIFIDLEELLTHLENLQMYLTLLEVARNQNIVTPFEKGILASFVYIQFLRNHAVMNSSLVGSAELGIDKFEYFVLLKWALSDKKFLYQKIGVIGQAPWVFYKTSEDTFPLTDSPILVNSSSVMVALSPRLLLEILHQPTFDTMGWTIREGVTETKLKEFRQRTIGNTFREIIFGNKNLLEEWQQSKLFRQRMVIVKNIREYNTIVLKEGQRELWQINSFGNQNLQTKSSKRKRYK